MMMMESSSKNHVCRAFAVTFIFVAALCAGLPFVASKVQARDNEVKLSDQAWACSTLFSRYPIKVLNGEERETAICLGEGHKGRQPMSRAEAFELCREQFNATSLLINWTSKGWNCRYYGR
jgi:hypothetical protein